MGLIPDLCLSSRWWRDTEFQGTRSILGENKKLAETKSQQLLGTICVGKFQKSTYKVHFWKGAPPCQPPLFDRKGAENVKSSKCSKNHTTRRGVEKLRFWRVTSNFNPKNDCVIHNTKSTFRLFDHFSQKISSKSFLIGQKRYQSTQGLHSSQQGYHRRGGWGVTRRNT